MNISRTSRLEDVKCFSKVECNITIGGKQYLFRALLAYLAPGFFAFACFARYR